MNKHTTIRYSESFKIQLVREYESSTLSRGELSKKYGIKGGQTLSNWIRKYGHASSQNKIIRVENPKEKDRLKALEKENQQLKNALSNLSLKAITNESLLEVIAEDLGISVDELKKKNGGK